MSAKVGRGNCPPELYERAWPNFPVGVYLERMGESVIPPGVDPVGLSLVRGGVEGLGVLPLAKSNALFFSYSEPLVHISYCPLHFSWSSLKFSLLFLESILPQMNLSLLRRQANVTIPNAIPTRKHAAPIPIIMYR